MPMLLCDRQDENRIKSLIHAWTYGGSPGANKSEEEEELNALRLSANFSSFYASETKLI